MNDSKQSSVIKRGAALILGNIVVLIALLVLIEGLAGWSVAFRRMGSQPVAERLHTRYDPELGWVSLPNVARVGMYGPGNDLHTNSRGFRGRAEYSSAVPPGRIRVVCSGDSFTLGYGVGDEATWCQRLNHYDARVEPVNMGQGGYGVDQAFLWYRRDAQDLAHDVHVFAFISDDFRRMTSRVFLGYPKPLLALNGDSLVIENTPVPRRSLSGWFTVNRDAIGSLRVIQIGQGLVKRTTRNAAATDEKDSVYGKATAILPTLLADLKELNDRRGSKLVLVYLPSTYDLKGPGPTRWSAFFQQQAQTLGVAFFDLYPHFRAMPADSMQKFFLQAKDLQFKAAAGHLNRAGNDLIASLLHRELVGRGILQ